MADAGTLNCLMCGAPTRTDAPDCGHCGARLATAACPSCFGMIFQGSTYCPLCGARAARADHEATGLDCPHCKTGMVIVTVGQAHLAECPQCHGFWVDTASFEKICADREQQAAVLGTSIAPEVGPAPFETKIRYLPCPTCQDLMHRINFAQCSGVVVDVCKGHGTWFDHNELHRVARFISSGGMDLARQKELARLEEERRRISAQRLANMQDSVHTRGCRLDSTDVVSAIHVVGRLIYALWR